MAAFSDICMADFNWRRLELVDEGMAVSQAAWVLAAPATVMLNADAVELMRATLLRNMHKCVRWLLLL